MSEARRGAGGLAAPAEVVDGVAAGDPRSLARVVSWLEADDPRGAEVLARLRRGAGGAAPAHLIGITGAPGSGKSTLVDRYIHHQRHHGRRVAVVGVDPTSPFSGGAILGDRIRMTRWHDDPGVFVRSMATRGQLGGLAAGTLRVAGLLAMSGFDRVVIETVGVGQSEVDVVEVADTTVLLLAPGAGDGIQAVKAGVMEIADVFVVAKADLPGADRLQREIRASLALGPVTEGDAWSPPIVRASVTQESGADALASALEAHRAHLAAGGGGGFAERRRRRVRAELAAAVRGRVRGALVEHGEAWVDAVLAGERSAEQAVSALIARLAVTEQA